MVLVKVGLLPLLGLGDAGAGNFHQVVDLLDKVIGSRDFMGQAREEVQGLTNVLAKCHQVGGEAGGGGLAAVDGQLTQAEVRGPGVRGAGQDKAAEDLLDQAVGPLSLAIRLGMVCSTVNQFGAKSREHVLPEQGHKARVAIREDLPGYAKNTNNTL